MTKQVLGYNAGSVFINRKVYEDVSCIGKVPKYKFIDRVSEEFNDTKNWISERVGETHNKWEVETVEENPGKIICYVEKYMKGGKVRHTILKKLIVK